MDEKYLRPNKYRPLALSADFYRDIIRMSNTTVPVTNQTVTNNHVETNKHHRQQVSLLEMI
jgi:hypothetical protein